MRRLAAVITSVVTSAAIAACGGSSTSTPSTTTTSTSTTTSYSLTAPCNPKPGQGQLGICVPHTNLPKLKLKPGTKLGGSLPHGVDVSEYQGRPNWGAARRSGLAFAIAKAGEGNFRQDYSFSYNYRALAQAGIPHTAYFFLRPGNPYQQARQFVAEVNSAGGFTSLPPVADDEVPLNYSVCTFANEVRRLTHWSAFVTYTSPGLWSGGSNCGSFLWVADYANFPINASSWSSHVAWQYSDGIYGPYPHGWNGVGSSLDMDVSTGLLSLVRSKPVHRPTPADIQHLHTLYAQRNAIRAHLLKAGCRVKHPHNYVGCQKLAIHGNAVNKEITFLRSLGAR